MQLPPREITVCGSSPQRAREIGGKVGAPRELVARQHEAAAFDARCVASMRSRCRADRRSARTRSRRLWRTSRRASAACSSPSRSPRRRGRCGVSKTGIVEPSPKPQISRSQPVGISLRCLPRYLPSGAKNSTQQYSVPPSRSITPITRWILFSRAMLREGVDGRAGNVDRAVPVALVFGASVHRPGADHRAEGRSLRIARDEGFGKEDELRAPARRVGGEVADFLEGAFSVERDRCGLDDGDSGTGGLVHAGAL